MFVNETFLTLYTTVNWHREFAVNFATFLKVCRDFFTFAPWFSYSPSNGCGNFQLRRSKVSITVVQRRVQ